ncbi:MAG: hypothetical protein RXO35_01635 [Candidatus Micrarchaeota archaeon]
MTVILAIKADDGIVLAADRQVTYDLQGTISLSFKDEKIVPIGENTIIGLSGDVANTGQLIELLKENSKNLDEDLFKALGTLKKKIGKIGLDCSCLLVGMINGHPEVVELDTASELDENNKLVEQAEIDIIPQEQRIAHVGDTISIFSPLNFVAQEYIEYVKRMGKRFDVWMAAQLANITIRVISKSGSLTIGNGLSIWLVKNDGEIKEVSQKDLDDAFETGYEIFMKGIIDAINRAMIPIEVLHGTADTDQHTEQEIKNRYRLLRE